MAVVGTSVVAPTGMLTLAEQLAREDRNGNVAPVIEALNQTNEIIQDLVVREGNLPTGDQRNIRTGLPDVYWRQINHGVPASHSTVATVVETCGQMEAHSCVDAKVMDLNGHSAEFRALEDRPFIEAMTQQFAHTLFYGDATKASEGFTGFATRYSSKKAGNAKNIIDCKGTGNNLTSIYLVGWGDSVYCPYPQGTKAGIQTTDLGKTKLYDENGHSFMGYETIYDWDVGLMVLDWRYVVRLCNIDVQQLFDGKAGTIGSGDTKTDTNILMKLTQAMGLIPRGKNTKLKLYMNSDVAQGLDVVASRSHSDVIKYMDATEEFGAPSAWKLFKGVPIRQCDQIVNTETQVK